MNKAKYKPLSFSTTMRNPERISGFLTCMLPYEGQVLTNALIDKIVKGIIQKRLYEPLQFLRTRPDLKALYDDETAEFTGEQLDTIIRNSIQNHKEFGFDKGWPSRFQTFYALPAELGFVQYAIGKPILFSDAGHALANACKDGAVDEKCQQAVFLNALTKYRANNPYRRVLNDNAPLILLLQVIRAIQARVPDSPGLARHELSFLICWPDSDAEKAARFILDFRRRVKAPTGELVYPECLRLLGATPKDEKYYKPGKILGEAVDEYIRKMRSTGILSLRGAGRYLDINSLEAGKVDYILRNYAQPERIDDLDRYFQYMGSLDGNIYEVTPRADTAGNDAIKLRALAEFARQYEPEVIREELQNVCSRRHSKIDLFKYIDEPTRLEFLTSIALVQHFPGLRVFPNYVVDDEGVPTRHASGGRADIICQGARFKGLVEVSLIMGRKQTDAEILPIARHLTEELQDTPGGNVVALFMAPAIFTDADRMAGWLKYKENLTIITLGCKDFVQALQFHPTWDDLVAGHQAP